VKKDRTATPSRALHPVDNVHPVSSSTTTVLPMAGRLVVSYYDWDLHLGFDQTLDEVATGTLVHAVGTITAVVRLSGGRVMAVISSADGNSAHVLLNADIVRMVIPALHRGNRLDVRGIVTRTTAGVVTRTTAGIDAGGVKVEIV
jgi:hypothetical protein